VDDTVPEAAVHRKDRDTAGLADPHQGQDLGQLVARPDGLVDGQRMAGLGVLVHDGAVVVGPVG